MIAWRWPLASNRIRGGSARNTFGMVRAKPDGTPRAHQGWDFAAPIGTDCRAIGSGVVELVEERGDYGLQIVLRLTEPANGEPAWAFYAHLSSASVKAGDVVTAGQVIGRTGESGNARGMPAADQHLHFELRTEPNPGLGLDGRISPLLIYGRCPLRETIEDEVTA